MFKKLPTNSRALLREIVNSDNPVDMLERKFAECTSHKQDEELRSLLRELQQEGYINASWADDVPYIVQINNLARTYDEGEIEYERRQANSTANNFYGGASNIQIQQNTNNSSQTMNVTDSVDYGKALEIFNNVLTNLDSFNLSNEDREQLKKVVSEAKSKAEKNTDTSFVKKSLSIVKDIMLKATGSLTAQGILFGIQQLGEVS